MRVDEVARANESCAEAFESFKNLINDKRYHFTALPRKGDIVLFDNTRLLHAREEIIGEDVRRHHRIWIEDLSAGNKDGHGIGLRINDVQLLAYIQRANGFGLEE